MHAGEAMLDDQRRIALAALGLAAFTVGTSELVMVGILDPIARAAGVSVSAAGTLVTAYALGIAVGGPIATALTTSYFATDVRRPGVSPAGIAFRVSSPCR